jgi:hypothetical protein
VSAEATGLLTVVAHDVATATDAVGPITYSDDAPASFPVGVTTIHWGAKDGAGNTSSAISTVTVTDSTPPVVTDNADLVLEATSADGRRGDVRHADGERRGRWPPAVTCDAISGATFALGETTVTCSATDTAGNIGSSSFTITVQDTTAPEIGNVADMVEEATSAGGDIVSYISPMADGRRGWHPVDQLLAGLRQPVPARRHDGHLRSFGRARQPCVQDFIVKVQDTTPPTVTVPLTSPPRRPVPGGAR